jgi:hypothetical protein
MMQNTERVAIYLRDRSRLTPAQRRRVEKHERNAAAVLNRQARRTAHRQVLRAERRRRLSIKAMFSRRVTA